VDFFFQSAKSFRYPERAKRQLANANYMGLLVAWIVARSSVCTGKLMFLGNSLEGLCNAFDPVG
jgi:hypothetical protein